MLISGDLGQSSEFYNVLNNDSGDSFTFPSIPGICSDCTEVCDYYNITDFASHISDGEIDITLTPGSDNIDDFCVDNYVYVSVEYCLPTEPAEPIPTMGEWGLMCLGLLLMIFGVVAIKERSLLVA